jgi:DnaJ-class molecular chaperone
MADPSCPKCKGTGRVRTADGTIQTCFDCLLKGEMDQHDSRIKDASELGFKI